MSSTVGTITVESAPRDPEKLANIGRFQLRRLAEELQLVDTDQKRSAFMTRSPADMAKDVSTALRMRDGGEVKTNGNGTPPVVAQVFVPPPPTPEPIAAPVPAQAPVQEAREPRTSQRTPVTTQVRAPTPAAAQEEDLRFLKILELESTKLKLANEGIDSLQSKSTKLSADVGSIEETVNHLRDIVLGISEQNKYLFSLVMIMAEEHINASRGSILADVVAGSSNIMDDLEYAVGGKGSEGLGELTVTEEEEGKE